MGGQESIVYGVELPGQQQPADSTKIRRNPKCVNGLCEAPAPHLKTMKDIMLNSFKKYPDNKCLGTIRSTTRQVDGKPVTEKTIDFLSYRDVQKKTAHLAAAVAKLKLAPEIEEVPGLRFKMIGVYSKNRAQWELLDILCMLYGYVLIPMYNINPLRYDTLGPENITYVFDHSNVENMFCSKAALETLLKTKGIGKLRSVICFDKLEEELIAKVKERGLDYYDFTDLLKQGSQCEQPQIYDAKPADIFTFSYTSGTTGPPKGAMLCHRNFASFCSILVINPDFNLSETEVYLSYLPLPHVLERMGVLAMLYLGASICFYSGDVQKLKEDIDVVRPTFFTSVPRLYTRFYDTINSKLEKTEGVKKILVDRALATKLENVTTSGNFTHKIYDRLVFNKTKQAFGGRMRTMISGSAPLLPHIHSFMKIISCAPLVEGYGQTESTGASFVSNSQDPICGHVGGPTGNVEYKLVDIPEMHYTHLDKDEKGQLMPRGEICMRGPGVFCGYYKDDEKTKEAIDSEGWLHSGDVGAILPGTGALKLIDRKKNIFKLQQGEYVAAEKVEAAYLKRHEVAEMFLYGDPMENFAIAVMVPNKEAIEEIGRKKNIAGTFEELCKNKEVRTELLNNLNAFTKKEGLQGFEQAKNVYLDPQPFLTKSILTNTMKIQRHEAKKVFKKELEDMYKEGMLGGAEKKWQLSEQISI